jgi:hypothetical protein
MQMEWKEEWSRDWIVIRSVMNPFVEEKAGRNLTIKTPEPKKQ